MNAEVVVVIGVGGIGQAIARQEDALAHTPGDELLLLVDGGVIAALRAGRWKLAM